MAEPYPSPARDRRRPGIRFLARTGRRTLAESLYLLIAPLTALDALSTAAAELPCC